MGYSPPMCGLFFTVQRALPLLGQSLSVILVGSIASIKGFEAFSAYDGTKAAVRSFGHSWIIDLKARGIQINVLSSGHIDTPGLVALMGDEQRFALNSVGRARFCTQLRNTERYFR